MMPRRRGKRFTAAFLLPYGRLMISAKCGTGSGDGVVLAFGRYRLDIERRELRRGTELIELEPRAFDLLAFLVRQRDRVVSKDDLLQAVWHGRIVSEFALTTRINAVRRALGDDGTAQRLRHGAAPDPYRWVAGHDHGVPVSSLSAVCRENLLCLR